MRHPRKLTQTFVAILAASSIAFIGCTGGGRGKAPAVPAPVEPDSAEVLAYVALPSLDGVLSGVSELANAIDPSLGRQAHPDQLKGQIGQALGDPQLDHLDASKPIAIAVLKPGQTGGMPLVVGFLPIRQEKPISERLALMGVKTKFADGVLTVAQTLEALEASSKANSVYASASGLDSTARIYIGAERLMSVYGDLIRNQMNGLVGLVSGFAAMGGNAPEGAASNLAGILRAELSGMLSLLGQCSSVQVDLTAGAKGFDVSKVVSAKAGSDIAALFSQSALKTAPAESPLAPGGALAMTYALDSTAFSNLFSNLFRQVASDTGMNAIADPKLLSLFDQTREAWDGTGVFTMDIADGSLAFDYVVGVKDGAKMLDMVSTAVDLAKPEGALGSLYSSFGLGIDAGLEKDVRKHGEVSIHRWNQKIDMKGIGAAGPGIAAGMLEQQAEIAAVGDYVVFGAAGAKMDQMIDSIQSGSTPPAFTLEAHRAFGPGRHGYLDYDLVKLMREVISGLPDGNPGAAQMKEALGGMSASKAPLVAATTFGPDRGQFQLRVPVELMRAIIEPRLRTAGE